MVVGRAECRAAGAVGSDDAPMRPAGTRGIFGHGTREAVLAAVHVLGPVTVADVARAVGTDADHAAHAIAHFERHGLVRVNRNGANRSYATIDWRSPLYDETRALAARIAQILGLVGEPRFAHRWGVGRDPRAVTSYAQLFGGQSATAALLHLAAVASDHVATMARALAIEGTVMAGVVARLERDGLVRRLPRDGHRRPVVLDDSHTAADEIRALLRGVLRVHGEHLGRRAVLRARRRRTAGIPVRDRARWTALNAAANLLAPFDRRYARVLVVLAARGLTTTGDLARALGGRDRDGVRRLARTLVGAGLVAETAVQGPHVVETAFALDPGHAAAAEIAALGSAAAATRGMRPATGAETAGPHVRGTGWPPDAGGRLAVLLAVRRGAGDLMAVVADTGWPRHRARRRLLSLAATGAVRLDPADGILRVSLDAAHPVAAEIAALLDAMASAGIGPRTLRTMYDPTR